MVAANARIVRITLVGEILGVLVYCPLDRGVPVQRRANHPIMLFAVENSAGGE